MNEFLSTGLTPSRMRTDEKKILAVRSRNFGMVKETLYDKGRDGVWRRCVHSDEKKTILREAHCGIVEGHYVGDATTRKVWQEGFWSPTIQRDALSCLSAPDRYVSPVGTTEILD